jgi:hypothetical protein
MCSNEVIVRGICLQLQHCGYDLQAVLYPMIDFIEQDLLAVEGRPELAFIALSLDRHPQDVCRSLQERDIVLAEFALRSAVDFQHTVGGAIALKDDIHGAANAVFGEQLRCSKPFFILKVIADDWFASAQGKPGRGFEIGAYRRYADNTFMPTDTCANKKPILRRQVL